MWSATRWQTYNIMCAFAGSKALNEAGIYKPADLIQFSWEKTTQPSLIEDEVIAIQKEIAKLNAANAKSDE